MLLPIAVLGEPIRYVLDVIDWSPDFVNHHEAAAYSACWFGDIGGEITLAQIDQLTHADHDRMAGAGWFKAESARRAARERWPRRKDRLGLPCRATRAGSGTPLVP